MATTKKAAGPETMRNGQAEREADADAQAAAGPWPELVPLVETPEALPFPLDVFPAPVRDYIEETAHALPCPPDYVAVPILVMLGGLLGASRALAIKPGHIQRGALFAAVCGVPGSAKSPAIELPLESIRDEEDRLHSQWEERMTVFTADTEGHEAALKAWKKDGCQGERPTPPPRPTLTRLTVDNTTVEAVAPILKENPRGVVMVKDELVAWVASMNQYREGGKGADQQFWLSAWSGATATIDRKGTHERGPLRVRHPFSRDAQRSAGRDIAPRSAARRG